MALAALRTRFLDGLKWQQLIGRRFQCSYIAEVIRSVALTMVSRGN